MGIARMVDAWSRRARYGGVTMHLAGPPPSGTTAARPADHVTGTAVVHAGWLTRHDVALACAVLALAALNLCHRLGWESVGEWDEALFALSAWEMVGHGRWFATTFHGALDYYTTTPPLNVWLIASVFSTWGASLVSLRVHAVVSAWPTVAVLEW